jgi:hypothetical protein
MYDLSNEKLHKIAKLTLACASTSLERAEAIRTALSLGMPLNEIEEYFDWLDVTSAQQLKESGDSQCYDGTWG